MEKNILICLEKMGTGGVETFVLTQAIELKRRGFNVYVMAKDGEYVKSLENHGIEWIEESFELENKFDFNKSLKIYKLLKEKNIGQVHIHQFPCVLSVWCACAIAQIPYVTYLHSGTDVIYNWYEYNYTIYKQFFREFFNNAEKIVAISKGAKNSNKNYYNIPEEKYIILNNSINLELFKPTKQIEKIKKFMIISRMSKEKVKSIKNAIDFFIKYSEKNPKDNYILDIYGDGSEKDEVRKYVEEQNTNGYEINMLNSTNEVKKVMDEHDVVMAVGRCVLEAIAMHRIAIISGNAGDEPLKYIVKPENIIETIENNFAYKDLKKENIENIIYDLSNYSQEDLKEIVETNYRTIQEKLDIKNNIYVVETTDGEKESSSNIFKIIIQIEQDKRLQIEKENKRYKAEIEEIREEIKQIQENNRNLKEELDKVYNSKRWKYIDKITKPLKNNRKP